jgi:hypothetical protein
MTGLAAAQDTKPAFLTESSIVPAPGGLYQFWYTSTCNGDPACDCDDQDQDLNGDGVLEPDQDNSCIATDPDSNGIYDTVQDSNNNGIPDLVDPDWTGPPVTETYQIASLATSLQSALDVYVDDWGLQPPDWALGLTRPLWIHDRSDDNGIAHDDGSSVELDTESMLLTSNYPQYAITHELWHMTQHAYDANDGAGNWSVEGQASLAPDRASAVLDTDPDSKYLARVNYYLANTTKTNPDTEQAQGLLGASYRAALWWAYLAEQAGTEFVGTPGEGMDFLKAVLEQAAIPPFLTGFAAVDQVLRTRIGRGFDDTFWDFTIANYAKDVDVTRLAPIDLDGRDPQVVLRYRDEVEVDAPAYGTVYSQTITAAALQASTGGVVAPVQGGVDNSDAMPDYGTKYFEVVLPAPADCPLATWQVLNFEGAQLMNSLLVLTEDTNGDDREEVISLARHQGDSFARGVLNKDEYTRFVAIVATTSEAAGFTWEASCTKPLIEIMKPTTTYTAAVGYPALPGRFDLWLEVKDSHTTDSVVGLNWQDFAVTVGGEDAEILNGSYLQNIYRMTVQAPDVSGAQTGDLYDLAVELIGTGASDSAAQAILYDLIPTDRVLVIDRSLSMADEGKLASAQSAARGFADSSQIMDQIGVVSFSNDAIQEFPLTQVPDQDDSNGIRTAANTVIDAIAPDRETSIGDGLFMGQLMLTTDGIATNEPRMVLLSDGMENEPMDTAVVLPSIAASDTRVQTIALGNEADRALMNEIAWKTCSDVIIVDGCYYPLDNDGVPTLARAAAVQPNLTNELSDIYRRIDETIRGHQRLWQDGGQTSGAHVIPLTVAEEGGRDAIFSFNWTDPKNPLNVTISGPSGATFTQVGDGRNHVHFFTPQLVSGDYTITLNGDNEWIGSLSARLVAGTEMRVYVDNTEEERKVLLPVQLQVSLSDDKGPVAGAAVVATVYRFDQTVEYITLRDDGVAPHDDQPHDGVYGYSYDRVNGIETHDITFDITAAGDGFTRYQRLTYRPIHTSRPDKDGDGLVDTWQQRYKVARETDDPDHDDLTNLQEMDLGTDPRHADTDHGGEHDGSEVEHGRNPLAAEDDALPPIADFWCQAHPGAVTLHFNPRTEYDRVRIFRNTNSTPIAPIGIFLSGRGVITDTVVNNGQNYVYFVQALAAGNVRGDYSIQRLCQPGVDPYPPVSELFINDDVNVTGSTTVTLHFDQAYAANGTPEITHVKLSNTPNFLGQNWQPFVEHIPWRIEPDPTTGWAYVYALVRDGAGNVSEEVLSDGILYDPTLAPSPDPEDPPARQRPNSIYLPVVMR